MDEELELSFVERKDEEGTGICNECGGQCLDPTSDGVGITRSGAAICSGCAQAG
ncbi:MAG: hypothetical protein ACR2RE_19090 [Geminicoccaceae bacterium]